MYKLVFFIPEEYKENVKKSLFEAGAGKYENYDMCSFEAKGTGQFRPLAGSSPFLGKTEELETVEEYRIEMLCSGRYIENVIKTLLKVHPYEEPAYEIYKVYDKRIFQELNQ